MVSPTTDRRLGLSGNTAFKTPVKAATTAAITLSGEQTVDGVACVSGDRVLVKNQASSLDNGIWDVSTASWTRSIDADGNYDLTNGSLVLASQGGQSGQMFRCSATNPVTPGTSALLWLAEFGPATYPVVNTIASLKALDKTVNTRAFVLGYYAAGDGGGGLYYYDSADTTTADNGGTVIVASDGGRWKLIYVSAINVRQFGAKGDGATDDTTTFTNANAASLNLYVPAGTFKLTNWQPINGTVCRGAGYLATFIKQGAAGSPAIFINNGNVNWQGLEFDLFTINGATTPTVAAFQITPGASGAIWRSKFKFCAQNTYQAFNVTSAGTNFFDNDVHIQSEGTVTTAVYQQSGTYNRYVLFLTNCANSIAFDHGGIDDEIWITTDGQIKDSGLNTKLTPKVENLYGTALSAGEAVISMTGTNQTLLNPSVILPLGSATKCTYAFKPSNGTIFQNPYVTSSGGATLANPFNVNSGFLWTIQGGQSNCTNKMETIYDESDNTHSLRYVTMLGDVSQYTTHTQTHGGKVTQYTAPNAPFSLNVEGSADVVIVEPTSGMATAQFNLVNGLVGGRVISFTTTQALTAITWVSAAGTTLMSTTLAAGGKASFVYTTAQNKFYPV